MVTKENVNWDMAVMCMEHECCLTNKKNIFDVPSVIELWFKYRGQIKIESLVIKSILKKKAFSLQKNK